MTKSEIEIDELYLCFAAFLQTHILSHDRRHHSEAERERKRGRARDICVFSCIPIMVLICVQKQSNHCSFCEMFNNSITDTQVSCTLFTFHVRSVSLCISQFQFGSRSLTCSISNIEQPTTQIEHLTICTDILSIYDFGGLFFSYSLGVCMFFFVFQFCCCFDVKHFSGRMKKLKVLYFLKYCFSLIYKYWPGTCGRP